MIVFSGKQGQQRFGVLAGKARCFLGLQVKPDGFRDALPKPCRPGQKLVAVIVVAGIQTGVAQIDICQHIARLKLDCLDTAVHGGSVVSGMNQEVIGLPGVELGGIGIPQLLGGTGQNVQTLPEQASGPFIIAGLESVFSCVQQGGGIDRGFRVGTGFLINFSVKLRRGGEILVGILVFTLCIQANAAVVVQIRQRGKGVGIFRVFGQFLGDGDGLPVVGDGFRIQALVGQAQGMAG